MKGLVEGMMNKKTAEQIKVYTEKPQATIATPMMSERPKKPSFQKVFT